MMATKRLKMSKKPPVIIQQLKKLICSKKSTKKSTKKAVKKAVKKAAKGKK